MLQLNFMDKLCMSELDPNIIFAHGGNWLSFKKNWQDGNLYALDIETTPKLTSRGNGLNPWENEIRLVQIGLEDGTVCICDLRELNNRQDFLNTLQSTLYSFQYKKILHNSYFDLLNLQHHLGFRANNIRDTQIFSIILSAGIKHHRHNLKAVCQRYLNVDLSKAEQTSDWAQQLSNDQLNYAANDVVYTLQAYKAMCEKIKAVDKELSIFDKPCKFLLSEIAIVESCCVAAFVDCTINGTPVNLPKAKSLLKLYKLALEDLKAPIEDKLGLVYTAQHTKLVAKVREVFNITLSTFEEGEEKDSTCSATLFQASEKEPLLLNLMLARSLKQQIDALERIIDSAEYFGDSRCRGWYNPLGSTGTGRSTCRSGSDKKNNFFGLNLQNLPKTIDHPLVQRYKLPPVRSCLEVTQSDRILGVIDLAASHQRLVASERLSGDDFLRQVLLDPQLAKRSHSILAADIAKLKGINITPEEIEAGRKTNKELDKLRNVSKTRFYSGLNKASWRTVQAALLKSYIICTEDDAKAASQAFDNRYEGVNKFQIRLRYLAKKDKLAATIDGKPFTRFRTPNGRLFYCPRYLSKYSNQLEPKISDVLAINWLDAEAMAIKLAMLEYREWLDLSGLNDTVKLLNNCHDELNLECQASDLAPVQKLAELMANHFQRVLGEDIPNGVETQPQKLVAKNYAEK